MDIGSGPNGLFENSGWFKLKFDGTAAQLPEGWPLSERERVKIRYGYKVPDGKGDIRIDCVYAFAWYTPLAEPYESGFGFHGIFVDFDEQGQGFTPYMGVWGGFPKPAGNEGTCEGFTYAFSGCNDGDFYSLFREDVAETWLDEGWALYEFYRGTGGPPDWPKEPEPFATGKRYWHPAWPYWALHQPAAAGGFPFVAVDFVDKALP